MLKGQSPHLLHLKSPIEVNDARANNLSFFIKNSLSVVFFSLNLNQESFSLDSKHGAN
jgi:hypothetical protein